MNSLLLLDLNVLHIHMEKKMVFIDAAASMKSYDAFNALKVILLQIGILNLVQLRAGLSIEVFRGLQLYSS